MGDPKKQRRSYERPKHPWRVERIAEENELQKKYGLKSKREIWRARSTVGKFREQARTLLGSPSEESTKRAKELLEKLNKQGLLESKNLEDVLSLTVEHLLDRRLQTIVCKKGLAKTPKHARQLIVHRQVIVGKNIVDVPRYVVPKADEDNIRLRIEIKEGKPTPKSARKDAAESAEPKEEKEAPKQEPAEKQEKEKKTTKKPAEKEGVDDGKE